MHSFFYTGAYIRAFFYVAESSDQYLLFPFNRHTKHRIAIFLVSILYFFNIAGYHILIIPFVLEIISCLKFYILSCTYSNCRKRIIGYHGIDSRFFFYKQIKT